jgi:hypothetical protein
MVNFDIDRHLDGKQDIDIGIRIGTENVPERTKMVHWDWGLEMGSDTKVHWDGIGTDVDMSARLTKERSLWVYNLGYDLDNQSLEDLIILYFCCFQPGLVRHSRLP